MSDGEGRDSFADRDREGWRRGSKSRGEKILESTFFSVRRVGEAKTREIPRKSRLPSCVPHFDPRVHRRDAMRYDAMRCDGDGEMAMVVNCIHCERCTSGKNAAGFGYSGRALKKDETSG